MRHMPLLEEVFMLPPLVLHPFSRPADASSLLECSRANLMLQEVIPRDGRTVEELRSALFEGRYCEMRMLFYIGRDLNRWVGQCLEAVDQADDPQKGGIRFQSFAALLTGSLPAQVEERLHGWGVFDHRLLFARALALNGVFAQFPEAVEFSEEFVNEYQVYADAIFTRRQQLCRFEKLDAERIGLNIYTSSEYSAILERGLLDPPFGANPRNTP